jgi:predicted membrane GTPase involved in stress response
VTINIIDTPGHADFGGEVERGLSMVDGSLLLVDASEGPLPQTRFVLRKALQKHLPVILVVNKVDRPTPASPRSSTRPTSCSSTSTPTDEQIDFPIVYASAKAGRASLTAPTTADARQPTSSRCSTLLEHHPGADVRPGCRCRRTSPTSTPRRTSAGSRCAGSTTARSARASRSPGAAPTAPSSGSRSPSCYMTEALERVPAEEAGPGDIIAVAGIPEITIGETLADPDDPRPLPVITVDEPSLSMTIGINTSPLAGRSGSQAHRPAGQEPPRRRAGRQRVDPVLPTERPDTWEVQGRGELQLAILVEIMRREGFELTVGKPQVVTRRIDGKLHEPIERLTIDVPEDYLGVVTQLLALRKGRMEQMVNHGTGWVRMEYLVPARGLIGFRTEFLTETRGTGLLHHVFEGYEPWHGELRTRRPARWSPTARRDDRPSRCSTCRSAARCSSARAPRSTRA